MLRVILFYYLISYLFEVSLQQPPENSQLLLDAKLAITKFNYFQNLLKSFQHDFKELEVYKTGSNATEYIDQRNGNLKELGEVNPIVSNLSKIPVTQAEHKFKEHLRNDPAIRTNTTDNKSSTHVPHTNAELAKTTAKSETTIKEITTISKITEVKTTITEMTTNVKTTDHFKVNNSTQAVVKAPMNISTALDSTSPTNIFKTDANNMTVAFNTTIGVTTKKITTYSMTKRSYNTPVPGTFDYEDEETGKYFTQFLPQFLKLLSDKSEDNIELIARTLEMVVSDPTMQKKMKILNETLADKIVEFTRTVSLMPADMLIAKAGFMQKLVSNKKYLSDETNEMIEFLDHTYTDEDADHMSTILWELKEFPNTTKSVYEAISDAFFNLVLLPLYKLESKEHKKALIDMANQLIDKFSEPEIKSAPSSDSPSTFTARKFLFLFSTKKFSAGYRAHLWTKRPNSKRKRVTVSYYPRKIRQKNLFEIKNRKDDVSSEYSEDENSIKRHLVKQFRFAIKHTIKKTKAPTVRSPNIYNIVSNPHAMRHSTNKRRLATKTLKHRLNIMRNWKTLSKYTKPIQKIRKPKEKLIQKKSYTKVKLNKLSLNESSMEYSADEMTFKLKLYGEAVLRRKKHRKRKGRKRSIKYTRRFETSKENIYDQPLEYTHEFTENINQITEPTIQIKVPDHQRVLLDDVEESYSQNEEGFRRNLNVMMEF